MASREESVDVSIAAALLKIGQLEKALAKAMKATVTLNTTAAMNKIKTLDNALTKATSRRSLTFDTARARAQIRSLDRELSKVGTGTTAGSGGASAVERETKARVLATRASASQIAAINREIAASSVNAENRVAGVRRQNAQQIAAINRNLGSQARAASDQAVAAEQNKARQIQAINQRLAAFQRTQQSSSQRDAVRAASQSIAAQRATLSAQLSQVRSLQNVGQQLTFGLTLPIAAAGIAVARLGFNFEDTINRIRVLTTPAFRTSKSAVDDLRTAILRLGPETGRAPTELAEGFYQIASAGVSGATALDVLKASAQAATIGLGDTNVVANIATSVLNAYGSSAGNAFQITNTLAEAVRLAKGEASEFAPVIGRLLPVAKNLGISFSDVAGSVALLTRNGLSASEATTQLRGLFNSFIKPSVQARKELDRVGLSSTALLQQLQAGDFIGAIGRIKAAFGNDQLGLGRLFRNQQGLNAFLTLSRDLPATAKALNDVAAAGKNADKVITGFDLIKSDPVVQFKIALSQVQAELIKIGTSIGPTVVDITKLAGVFLNLFNSLPSGVKTFVGLAVAAAALAGPFLLVYTATQRLSIAKQQLALAQGQVTGASASEGAALGRLGSILSGNAGGVLKFAGALGVLAAIAGGLQLGQQLGQATSGGEKLGAQLSIAGSALGAFIAGATVGGPVVGGLAAAATVGAAAIGSFSEKAKAAKKPFDDLKNSLVGVTDAAQVAATVIPTIRNLLENPPNKFSTLTFPDFQKAGLHADEFAKAIVAGDKALEKFNAQAGQKVAVSQLAGLNAEIAKGPKLVDNYSNEARALFKILGNKVVSFSDKGEVLGIKDQTAALKILNATAVAAFGEFASSIQGPIQESAVLNEVLGVNTQAVAEAEAAYAAAEETTIGFGSAADGAAISISDLATALDTAVTNANALNQAKLDTFTGQADQAAALAGLFEVIDKNKDVLPHLGDQFDLTTQAGRDQAKAAAEVSDALAGQVGEAQKRATALLGETDGVNKAKGSYYQFLSQLGPVATAAGLTQDQFALVLAGMGGDFATFATGIETSGAASAAAAKSAIDGLLGAIPADAADAVKAIKEPSDQVAALANQISLLPDSKITEVFAQVTNKDTVDQLAEVVQDLPPDKQIAVLAAVSGIPDAQALTDLIVDGLPPEKVAEIRADVQGTPQAQGLQTAIDKLPETRRIAINAAVVGKLAVDGMDSSVNHLKSKTIQVAASTSGVDALSAMERQIANIKSKQVQITATTKLIAAQGAGLKIVGHNPDGTPIYGRSGMHFGPGGVRKMAQGGVITGMSRQSMIVRQRAAQGILWGEPETMGEAYISYAQRFRGRNRKILSRVARDFGMMVVPMRPMAAGGMTVQSRPSGMSDAQFAMLARALTTRTSSRGDAPIIGNVTLETKAQTPQAVAVETVGAIGARLQERLADRF